MAKDKDLELRLDKLLKRIVDYHPEPNLNLVKKAFDFAMEQHGDQIRRSGEKYMTHPLGVAELIAELKLDVESICAGLLHDTVEDTLTTFDALAEVFGEDIAFLVDGVTKLSKFVYRNREERQAESFRKMIIAMSRDLRVILVKLADRLHNMRTLGHLKKKQQIRISGETLDIYAPIANRLGISWIKSELEDLTFRYLNSEEYYELAAKVNKKRKVREKYIDEVVRELEKAAKASRIPAEITGRPKHLYSIWCKIRMNMVPFEQVFDILAFRVVVDNIQQCYEALGLVHSLWKPVTGRFKDYIAIPKPNGYRSLHTSIIGPKQERIEVQIRTKEMHKVAELGVAAHWRYKETRKHLVNEKYSWLRQLMEFHLELDDPNEFMDAVKIDLFTEETYVFTPKGEVRILQKGATPIDFAYSIHTEIGHHCIGGKVNGQIVPLRYKLHNGDTVEIMTHTNQRPNKDWLTFVASSRARAKIRQYIRKEQREQAISIGHEILEKELKGYGFNLNKAIKSGELEKASHACKISTHQELFAQIGYQKFDIKNVLEKLIPEDVLEKPPEDPKPERESLIGRFFKDLTMRQKTGIRVDGVGDLLVRYAKCCNPVPYEKIIGFVTRGRGVTVHTEDCHRVATLEVDRQLNVYWDDHSSELNKRSVDVQVISRDVPGLLASISTGFTKAGINISKANCETYSDNKAISKFQILVSDLSQLQEALTGIRRIPGVKSVERLRA